MTDPVLRIYNDRKERPQSFEAWVYDLDCPRGYGQTEKEAISDYKEKLSCYIERLSDNIEKAQQMVSAISYCGFQKKVVSREGVAIV